MASAGRRRPPPLHGSMATSCTLTLSHIDFTVLRTPTSRQPQQSHRPQIERNLPRHQFGSLQGKMFPAYFTLISACSAISVAAFAYLHPWKTAATIERYQLGFLLMALGCNLSNLLVITPMMVEMMMKRYKIEKDFGIGSEVGHSKNKEMTKRNPALAAMNRKFGIIHALSSLASLMSFGSLAMHSWYLSSKLDL